MTSSAVLLVPAHPAYYPHAQRHAQVWAEQYGEIAVAAIFPKRDSLPPIPNIRWVSVGETMPVGTMGFLRCMVAWFRFLCREKPLRIEAIDPPTLIPAAVYSLFRRTVLMYFSMEIYPDLPSLRHRPWKRHLWAWAERWAARRAQSIFTVNSSVAQVLSRNLTRAHIGVVRNTPPRWQPTFPGHKSLRSHLGLDPAAFILIYQGKLEEGRGLEAAAEALIDEPSIQFVLLGYGPLQSWVEQRAQIQANVHFGGAHPFERLMEWAAEASAGLAWIEPLSESYRLSLPGKIFEYVQNGLPILVSPLPEMQKIVRQYHIGEVADSLDIAGFTAALIRLRASISHGEYAAGLARAKEELCWEREREAFAQAIQDCG